MLSRSQEDRSASGLLGRPGLNFEARQVSAKPDHFIPCKNFRASPSNLNLPSFRDRISGEQAALACVLVCPWRAGFLCTAVHPAARLCSRRDATAR